MTKDEALELAEGKSDEELFAIATGQGALDLACAAEGIESTPGLSTKDFSRSNPWAHIARRTGSIETVEQEVPRSSKPGNESVDGEGNVVPATTRVFKGE
jgi:hypothetical protein